MLIVGYCFGIRSERQLCEEVHLNLAYRWFCRLGLEDPVPDHSTFSKNRHGRFRDRDTLRFVFEQVLERCVREGLVGGEGFAIDASLVKADANRQRGVPGTEADWADRPSISRPVREYLMALDQTDLEKNTPKNVSLTDPAAQWSAAWGPAFYAYSANYLIDIAAGIVVDVEATPAHKLDESNATKTMIGAEPTTNGEVAVPGRTRNGKNGDLNRHRTASPTQHRALPLTKPLSAYRSRRNRAS